MSDHEDLLKMSFDKPCSPLLAELLRNKKKKDKKSKESIPESNTKRAERYTLG